MTGATGRTQWWFAVDREDWYAFAPMKPQEHDRVEGVLKRIVRLGLASELAQDWNRFYKFIALAHAHRRGWDHHDVREMLVRYGIAEGKARMFSEVYWHGRCLLYSRDHFSTVRPEYAGWVRKGGTLLT